MIYTVTLNPSIDYALYLDKFTEGETNRSNKDLKFPGGKGIMVSKLLKNLGADPINLGFIGGTTGEFIKTELTKLGIRHNFTNIKNDTRINIKIKSTKETEINAQGPIIYTSEINDFLTNFSSLKKDDIVILSGSVPSSLNKDIYLDIIKILDERNINFTIDTNSDILLKALKYKPLLVKPNLSELEALFKCNIEYKDIPKYANLLLDKGAKAVIISLGADGSMFFNKNFSLFSKALNGTLISSVGCGDSMVGGYTYSISTGLDEKLAYKNAIACASATAFSDDIGTKQLIDSLLNKVILYDIKEINYEY